jgi:hypothetical protein
MELESLILDSSRPPLTGRSWSMVRDWCVGCMQRRDLPDEERIRWGALAVEAARRKHSEGGVAEVESVAEEVLSRSYMIKNFGPGDADSVRDPADLLSRAVAVIGREREEISRAADDWRRQPVGEIRSLRQVKNILTPLRAVLDHLDEGSVRQDLRAWLDLIPKLP